MKAAIRLAVFLVMAGASTAVLADSMSEGAQGLGHEQLQQTIPEAKATSASDDFGHGSGEPGRSASQIKADDDALKATALREERQAEFLNEVWRTSP